MENKDAEKPQLPAGSPAPAAAESTQTPAAPVTVPATENAENKNVSAFIRMRKAEKANKMRIAELEAKLASAPAAAVVETPAPAQTVTPVTQAPPAQKAEAVDSEESVIQEMAKDSDVASVPGGIIDIMDLVDSDPKLVKLNAIDSALAFREAKAMWKSKLGITTTPITPAPVVVSGGITPDQKDLAELFKRVDAAKPGTKAYRDAVKLVNEAMGRK